MSEQKQVGAEVFQTWYSKRYPRYSESIEAGEGAKPTEEDEEERSRYIGRVMLYRDAQNHQRFHQETWNAALASQPEPPSAELLRAAKAVLDLWDDDTAILNDGKLEGNDAAADQACDSFRDLRTALSRAESADSARSYDDGVNDAVRAQCIFCRDKAHTIWDGKMKPHYAGDVNPVPIFMERQYVSNNGEMEGWVHPDKYGYYYECHADAMRRALLPEGEKAHAIEG